ncbi:MAG TPA: flagellar motor protein MotB [Terracidiphilus sp.]|nr:flagellar motor protein MotB [Terracidiphilus sp.]
MNPRVHRSRVSHDRWLVSYADFITLLFAFFVVLYAFALADKQKPAQISAAIDTAFQSLAAFNSAAAAPPAVSQSSSPYTGLSAERTISENEMPAASIRDDLNQIRRELEQTLSRQISNHTIAIQMGRDGLVISLREAGFFNSGSASPRPDSIPTLRKIAASLGQIPYDVRIEGHTDNVPMHNAEFDSNWELSSARATRIARLFLVMHAIAPSHLSAAGYAEFHPVAGNDTPEGRAENRRVDLVVLPRTRFNFLQPNQASGKWRKITDE